MAAGAFKFKEKSEGAATWRTWKEEGGHDFRLAAAQALASYFASRVESGRPGTLVAEWGTKKYTLKIEKKK